MRWVTLFENETAAHQALEVNDLRRLKLGERRICLARTATGFYAIADACPHRYVSLSEGQLNYLEEVVCPWHNYRFALKSGRECQQRTPDAETYPLKWEDGALKIGIADA